MRIENDFCRGVNTFVTICRDRAMFRDVTTLFNNASAFEKTVSDFEDLWHGEKVEAIAGIDARGFIIGGALALQMKLPFVVLRKKGKLPYMTVSEEYDLEYGKATIEMHKDSIDKNDKVIIIDDLIATGGTAGSPNRGSGGNPGYNGYGIVFSSNSVQSNSSGNKTLASADGGVNVGNVI